MGIPENIVYLVIFFFFFCRRISRYEKLKMLNINIVKKEEENLHTINWNPKVAYSLGTLPTPTFY